MKTNLNSKVEITPITFDNWEETAHLTVTPEQEQFWSFPVIGWMARCHYDQELHEWAITSYGQPVGFVITAFEESAGRFWILTMMIDKQHQRQGLGRVSLEKIVSIHREHNGNVPLYLSHDPQNIVASTLYESMGFTLTGEEEEGELLRVLA